MYNLFFFFALESHRIFLLGPQVSASVLFSFFLFSFLVVSRCFSKASRHIRNKDER